MTLPATVLRTDAASATRVWDVLAERVESFIQVWESSPDPPNLADYLPKEPPALRFMTLVELIKVDLEYQWQWGRDPKSLERYLLEFPELGGLHGAPCDLIYEEFHIRRQAGDPVEPEHYLQRFPRQAEELGKLLKLDRPRVTTALFPVKRMAEIEPGQQLDDFNLLSKLGAGAFATVYLAWQRTMQRQVALKVSGDQGNEPQTLSRLDHPHIVRVYDQRTLPDRKLRLLYMQYVPGGTLQAVVETIRRVPAAERSGKHLLETVDKALEPQGGQAADSLMRHKLAGASWPYVVCWMGARLASALDYAHRQGVLHRDVKPANVLLAADGSPKLADFNISYNAQLEGATPAAYFGGSLPYMSTEQLEACNPAHARKPDELDGRSDVYSLGILLWELLVGRRPFEDVQVDPEWSKTLEAMCQQRAGGVPLETQRELPSDCPAGLEQVLLQCLAANADDRFVNAGQLARQLELCLQPKAQQLLRPRRANVPQAVRRYSIPVLALAAILPNAASSVLNVIYNWKAIVEGSDPVAQAVFRDEALITVNVLIYSTGIGLLTRLAWPVCAAVWRLGKKGAKYTPSNLVFLRRRCLWIGDFCAWMTFAGWTTAGLLFAVWIHLASREQAFDFSRLLHFVASHMLCGLVAGTLTFFGVSFMAVRYLFPPLIREEIDDAETIGQLSKMRKRLSWYFVSAVASPLLSVMFLAMIGLQLQVQRVATMDAAHREALLSSAGTQIQVAFSVVGLLGMLVFGLSWYFSRAIESDLGALSMAVAPAPGTLISDSTTVDSFWTSGER